jgi:bifunctional DNase/RNase
MDLEEVHIEALKEETFYAIAKLRSGDTVQEVDTRPSDALALAVRTNSPIYVTEEVMDRAGLSIPTETREKAAIENWYYSPLREAKTDFPAEELEKLPPQLGPFVAFGPEKPEKPTPPPWPSEEEAMKQKEAQSKGRQELVSFVFAT